jgi:hypothetical protein
MNLPRQPVRQRQGAFARMLAILQPYLPTPREGEQVEEALKGVDFPPWVVNWDYELGSDEDGLPDDPRRDAGPDPGGGACVPKWLPGSAICKFVETKNTIRGWCVGLRRYEIVRPKMAAIFYSCSIDRLVRVP